MRSGKGASSLIPAQHSCPGTLPPRPQRGLQLSGVRPEAQKMFLLELLRCKKPSRFQETFLGFSFPCPVARPPTRPDTGLSPGWLQLVPSRQGTSLNPQGLAPSVTQRRFQIRWVSDGEERRSHRSEEWGGENGTGTVKNSCFSPTSGAPRLCLIRLLLLSWTFTSGAGERGDGQRGGSPS